jgi:RHS repeat-associated protein
MDWNFMDQLRRVDLGGGGTAHYVYGLGGQRMRKVIERNGNLKLEWIFLGAVMIFRRRRRDTDEVRMERWTVHISDDTGPIAQVDTKTRDDDGDDPGNPLGIALVRYQYANHLGSATLETDDSGNPVSYEEYHPYGTTAYRSARQELAQSLKRYRFSGKERDDETGMYYIGARYYAPWLGRWSSSDPVGPAAGTNLFRYCANSPILLLDPTGTVEVRYELEDLNLTGVSDPTEAATRARSEGFDFTGFDAKGQEQARNDAGVGTGVPKRTPEGWNFGIWLKRPGEGTSDGKVASNGVPAEIPPKTSPDAAGSISKPDSPPSAGTPGTLGSSASQSAPAAERFIWNHAFSKDGVRGSQRGFILENMYNNMINLVKRNNTANYDAVTATHVKQIKSIDSASPKYIRSTTARATKDASAAVSANPNLAGKKPQAVVISQTDSPAWVGDEVKGALSRAKSIANAPETPQHVRGLPGNLGALGRLATVVGAAFSAFALGEDIAKGDVPMGIGNAFSTAGGILELTAIAGIGVAGFSAMTLGLVAGGLGIAISSAVSGIRALEAGDKYGATAGVLGVLGGLALTAGAITLGSGLLAFGILASLVIGGFHSGRYYGAW